MASLASASTSQIVTLPHLPELFDPNFLDVLLPPSPSSSSHVAAQVTKKAEPSPAPDASSSTPTNPLMTALKASSSATATDNGDPAFKTTGSALLDTFQALAPQSETSKLADLLKDAWAEDPALTLRMIWNTRSIHDGKGEKELFYKTYGWLFKHHPRTAVHNLSHLVKPLSKQGKDDEPTLSHGYYKDLLNILTLVARDELTLTSDLAFLHHPRGATAIAEAKATDHPAFRSDDKAKRAEHRLTQLNKHLEKPGFRAMYIAVARIFAQQIEKDLVVLKKVQAAKPKSDEAWEFTKNLSLVGKWAPTPGGAHDKETNIASAVALLLFSSGALKQGNVDASLGQQAAAKAEDLHALRASYSRHLLTPLRRALGVPEPLMSTNKWKEIHYGRIASAAMKNNTEAFIMHDPEGFEKYLTDVESGTKSMSGATLMPHTLVADAMEYNGLIGRKTETETEKVTKKTKAQMLADVKAKMADTKMRVINAQWRSLVDRLRESGALEGSLAVCDVSGSMGSIDSKPTKDHVAPVLVAVALSLILAQIAKPPFAGGFITFSETPEFAHIDPEGDLLENINKINGAAWGMSTDFRAVFLKLILPLAVKHKIKAEDMVKRIFVFSDMQFNQAGVDFSVAGKGWETSHETIVREYKEAGYEVPEIVYWNLAAQTDTKLRAMPVQAETPGVALLNGFSPALLKIFMGEEVAKEEEEGWDLVEDEGASVVTATTATKVDSQDKKMDPVSVMKKALNVGSFMGLKVMD